MLDFSIYSFYYFIYLFTLLIFMSFDLFGIVAKYFFLHSSSKLMKHLQIHSFLHSSSSPSSSSFFKLTFPVSLKLARDYDILGIYNATSLCRVIKSILRGVGQSSKFLEENEHIELVAHCIDNDTPSCLSDAETN